MGPNQENLYPMYDLDTTLQMIERGPYGSAFAQHIAAKFLLQPIAIIISHTGAEIIANDEPALEDTAAIKTKLQTKEESKKYIQTGGGRKEQYNGFQTAINGLQANERYNSLFNILMKDTKSTLNPTQQLTNKTLEDCIDALKIWEHKDLMLDEIYLNIIFQQALIDMYQTSVEVIDPENGEIIRFTKSEIEKVCYDSAFCTLARMMLFTPGQGRGNETLKYKILSQDTCEQWQQKWLDVNDINHPVAAQEKNNEKCLECIIGFFYWSFWHRKTDAFDNIKKNTEKYEGFKSTKSHNGGDFVSQTMVANRVNSKPRRMECFM